MSAPTIPHMDVEPVGGHVGGPVGGVAGMELAGRAGNPADALIGNPFPSEPTEDTPHVMISLALEDDQRLDINAWEQWLNAFPAMAKYVKIQGVFKSHSTLVLVSMPVMVWDLLPEDPATSFIAFIRSNNIAAAQKPQQTPVATPVPASQHQSEALAPDTASLSLAFRAPLSHQQRQAVLATNSGNSASTLLEARDQLGMWPLLVNLRQHSQTQLHLHPISHHFLDP